MIIRKDLTQAKSPRGRRTEYTRRCGWIDWAHATPDRDDLKAIWSALKSPPVLTNGRVDPRDRSRVAMIKVDGKLQPYIRVPFSLEMSTKLYIVSVFPKTDFTGYVRLEPDNTPQFYKRAAASLYFFACSMVEWHQGAPITQAWAHSSFSMEDMVSNKMAFHQLVDGLSADELIERCGGWKDRDEALRMSTLVFDAMEKAGADQPQGGDWDYAHLYNDIANVDNSNKDGGWNLIPHYFRLNYGIFRTDHPAGSTVGIDWDEEDWTASLYQPVGKDGDHLGHLRGHQPTMGSRFAGRKPGPQGLA